MREKSKSCKVSRAFLMAQKAEQMKCLLLSNLLLNQKELTTN